MSDKTILYVEDLLKVLHGAHNMSLLGDRRAAGQNFLDALRKKLRELTSPATPEPKYKKDDWVVSPSLRKDTEPWQVMEPNGPYGLILRNLAGNDRMDIEACDLLAIPPKPETMTSGYELTGEVEVADGTKPYVEWVGEAGAVVTIDCPANTDSFGGLRWIAKRNNKCTECGQEMPK